MNVYEVAHLTKIYPKQTQPANDEITLNVEAGEIFGLLGDNGAGKTTLIRQMANLLAPTSGTIRLFGQPLAVSPLYTPGQIGYMPQNGMALNNLTVGETLYYTAHLRGFSRREARAERDRLIERLDLGSVRDRMPPRISGGQRRLMLLATTITTSPPVLLLDEPTNDLDPQHRRLVWEVIRDLKREHGTTTILVTHNVTEAERVIERVGIMQAGKLIAVGRPGVLKAGLNEQLRLEIVFPPESPPRLPNGTPPREVAPGRWQLLIERDTAPIYLEALTHASQVEDFSLSTATLEDLYLTLAEAVPPIPGPSPTRGEGRNVGIEAPPSLWLCVTHIFLREGKRGKMDGETAKQRSEEVAMIDDLDYIELGDTRLNERLKRLVEQLSGAPERSIPGACEEWHETKAAYRFF